MVSSLVNFFLFNPPQQESYSIRNDIDIIRLKTSRGNDIAATFVDRKATVTILFSHGNAEDLNSCCDFMHQLSTLLDVNVMGYDFSGYGGSTGSPSEANCYADIERVYEYLRIKLKTLPEHIVLYGRSLGSGPSCYLASKTAVAGRSIAGLILHAPFTSVYRIIFPDFGFTVLGDQFPNIDRMQSIECPVFIAHGAKDEIVPYDHGVALINAVPVKSKAELISPAGMRHNHYETWDSELAHMEALDRFLDYHILARRLWMKRKPVRQSRHKVYEQEQETTDI